jgi:hypothetical protein
MENSQQERRKFGIKDLSRSEIGKSIIAYIPQAIAIAGVAVAVWVLRIHYTQKDVVKRVEANESKIIVQWTNNSELKEMIKLLEQNSSNHSEMAKEAIGNIKGRLCELRDRITRVENVHIK